MIPGLLLLLRSQISVDFWANMVGKKLGGKVKFFDARKGFGFITTQDFIFRKKSTFLPVWYPER